jgi:hypothetical protein
LVAVVGALAYTVFEVGGYFALVHGFFALVALAHVPLMTRLSKHDRLYRDPAGVVLLVLMLCPWMLLTKDFKIGMSISFVATTASFLGLWVRARLAIQAK